MTSSSSSSSSSSALSNDDASLIDIHYKKDLTEFPTFSAEKIKKITIAGCGLIDVPSKLASAMHLTSLSLNGNKIVCLDSVKNLKVNPSPTLLSSMLAFGNSYYWEQSIDKC